MDSYKKKLIVGSSVIAVGSIISGIINIFLYLFLIRTLSFSDYGIYASLFAVISYCTFFSSGLTLYFTKLGSLLKNRYNKVEIQEILKLYSIRIAAVVAGLSLLFFLFSIKIPYAWFVFGLSLLAILQPMVSGLLQGLQKFSYLSALSVVSTVLKATGVLVVIWFFNSLNTILLAILMSIAITYLITVLLFQKIYRYAKTDKEKVIHKNLLPNFWQLSLVTIFFNSLINADILLVKRFLNPIQAGMYASEMNLAKGMLFATSILSPIMYSLTSEIAITNKKGNGVSNQTLIMTVIFGFIIVIFFKFLPQTIFTTVLKKSINPADNQVWIMALAMTMYGLSDVMIHYLLSQNKTSILIPLFITTILQIILITFYHSSIFQISMMILIVNSLLFFCSGFFYKREIK